MARPCPCLHPGTLYLHPSPNHRLNYSRSQQQRLGHEPGHGGVARPCPLLTPPTPTPLLAPFMQSTATVLAMSRVMVAWQPVGIISGVYDIALRYCGERVQFDAPLTAYQITQVSVRGVGGVGVGGKMVACSHHGIRCNLVQPWQRSLPAAAREAWCVWLLQAVTEGDKAWKTQGMLRRTGEWAGCMCHCVTLARSHIQVCILWKVWEGTHVGIAGVSERLNCDDLMLYRDIAPHTFGTPAGEAGAHAVHLPGDAAADVAAHQGV